MYVNINLLNFHQNRIKVFLHLLAQINKLDQR